MLEEIKINPDVSAILKMNKQILDMNQAILKRILNPMLIINQDARLNEVKITNENS